MYSQAVDKSDPKGKTRFFESYRNPLTGEMKTISVTLDRNTSQSRKSAQTILSAKIDKLISDAVKMPKMELSLSEVIERYNDDQERDDAIRESTWSRNHKQMKACLRILGQDTIVNSLTAAYVNDCFRNSGESNGKINERVTRFKSMMRWANQNGYVQDVTWLSGIKTYKNPESKEKLMEKFMESSELKLLLESIDKQHWRLVTAVLALSGLRIGEFIALDVSDIAYDTKTPRNGYIRIRKTYYSERKIVMDKPKTDASNRDVYIQPELAEVINKINAYRESLNVKTDIFFPNRKGGRMNYFSYCKYLREKTEKVLGRRLTPHALRHTHTSLLAEKGVPLEVISRRLGHGDSEITRQVYLHVTKGMEDADRKLLESIKLME